MTAGGWSPVRSKWANAGRRDSDADDGAAPADQSEADGQFIRRVSIGVSSLAVLAIAVHLIWPKLKVDLVTVALLIFGSVPWLRGIVQSISLPGGPSIDLRDDRLQIITREEKQKDAAVAAVGTAAKTRPPGERAQEIERLADLYHTPPPHTPPRTARPR